MFDLPVDTKKRRKDYTEFRKRLIKDGFFMIQFSIYGLIARNNDDAQKHVNRVKNYLPTVGSVRVLTVTERQYASMLILVGKETAKENYLKPTDILEL